MYSSRAAETGVAYMPPPIKEGGIRFLLAGDRFVLVEVGEGMELSLNIKVIQLAKRILVEEDNKRRDETEGGIANLPKAKKYIHNSFIKIFN